MAENFALLSYLAQLMESTTESVETLDSLVEHSNLPQETKLMLVQARQTLAVQMNTVVYLSEELAHRDITIEALTSTLTIT